MYSYIPMIPARGNISQTSRFFRWQRFLGRFSGRCYMARFSYARRWQAGPEIWRYTGVKKYTVPKMRVLVPIELCGKSLQNASAISLRSHRLTLYSVHLYGRWDTQLWGTRKFLTPALLRGYCTPDQFFDCLCIFLKNYNTLVASKTCFL